jgi:serine/threonine protein kinase
VLRRRVAIKVLPSALAEDEAIRARFRLEAQASAQLEHPSFVRVYDFSQEGRLHYLVMEHVEGPNLQHLLARRGPLPVARACEYARQTALALQAAHDAGLVHRDVKPANLIVDRAGKVKVLDLGLVRCEVEEGDPLTKKLNDKMVLGTADYLAPEQALSLHDVDGRADVYSLGATLYALLAGQPPFHKGTLGQKLIWHQTVVPEPVHTHRPEVPLVLSAVVARMLAKKPEDRFASAAAAAEALAPWAEAGSAEQALLSQRSMVDIRLGPTGPVSANLSCGLLRGRLPHDDTAVAQAGEDTGKMSGPRPRPAAPAKPAPAPQVQARPGRRWLLFGGLALAAGGLIGGLLALLR